MDGMVPATRQNTIFSGWPQRGGGVALLFFPGLHQPSDAKHFPRCFISLNRLWSRKSDFVVRDWIADSGAFSELSLHGGYRKERSVAEHARQIERWRSCGNLLAAVQQDYMVEDFMLVKTGKSVEQHQRMTVNRYLDLRDRCGDIVMPVLQGQSDDDYKKHLEMFGDELRDQQWCGVGSVCKRKNDSEIRGILSAILAERDLRLHGFGLKFSALRCAAVTDMLYSADSMAWSFAARLAGKGGNDWRDAMAFSRRLETMARQMILI